MNQGGKHHASSSPDLGSIGGATALNFVNTLRADGGVPVETLRSDQDVRAWMRKMGLRTPARPGALPAGALLESAKRLRELTLFALEQHKAGRPLPLTALNAFLAQSSSYLKLHRHGEIVATRREYRAESAEQFLAPVAEAVAELLATADFARVRRCEGSGCVLWFLDRPNGRPRRFCTEESCGTRTRVAAYRARLAKRR